jgi:hypothetical protein
MLCQQVTVLGYAEEPKVADTMIEAASSSDGTEKAEELWLFTNRSWLVWAVWAV